MEPVLIISFWNPTKEQPYKGLFIHEQVYALCRARTDILFLEVNILPSKKSLFSSTVTTSALYSNKKTTLDIHSVFWKLIYINPWLLYLLVKRCLHKHHAGFNPKIVHSNVIFPCAIVGYFIAKHFNAGHVISEHWSKAEKLLKHPVYGKISLKTYSDSKAILCVSDFLANKIRSATRHPNIIIVPNIIDTGLFRHVPANYDNAAELRFTCVATWTKPKRLDLIVNSLATYATETNKTLILNVVGEGLQKDELSKSNLPKNLQINWLGYITKIEIVKILTQTDIFMHASEIETFSIVTVEALATGTPVLASNKGALPELISSHNGILVENTPEAWVEGIKAIIIKKFDFKAIASDISEKYSPDLIATKIIEVYNNVLKAL
jgi:glycosyltransferase involved in cell wall biosynthesis